MEQKVKRLLDGCRRILSAQHARDTVAVVEFLGRMRADLPRLQERVRRKERSQAPSFNVFQALGIERREAVLHTPLLAYLLNPDAAHGQGFLFLNTFFSVLGTHDCFSPPRFGIESCDWLVDAEVPAGHSNVIDLLIECPAQGYVLVVENKIDAAEGASQVWRYARWMERRRPQYRTRQIALLTPDGRAPTSHRGLPCVRLSYARDIFSFLEAALPAVEAPVVRQCVRQYLAVVKKISEAPYENGTG